MIPWKPLLFMKSGGFHWKAVVFTWKPYKSTNWRQILQFHCVLGGGYVSWFHENCHFSRKVVVFTEKQWFSLGNLINQLIEDKSFSFIVCWGEAMSHDSMKTATFQENCHFSWKPPLFTRKPHQRLPIARNGNPDVSLVDSGTEEDRFSAFIGVQWACEKRLRVD